MPPTVYRGRSATDNNLTRRPDTDTKGKPGQAPGLSTFSRLDLDVSVNAKAQVIDLELLVAPLRAIPDTIEQGGTEGHFSIAPVREDGAVDVTLLQEWAESRGTGQPHWLTEILKEAIVDTVKRAP